MIHTQLTLFINNFKTHTIMDKTTKIVLQAIGYIISLIIGAAGGATLV
jgi:hypothetical protein